jgi:hypothetical protein
MDNEMREGDGTTCTHEGGCQCTAPQEAEGQEGPHEEITLAFLLALMPLVVLTFFGQVGLI